MCCSRGPPNKIIQVTDQTLHGEIGLCWALWQYKFVSYSSPSGLLTEWSDDVNEGVG